MKPNLTLALILFVGALSATANAQESGLAPRSLTPS